LLNCHPINLLEDKMKLRNTMTLLTMGALALGAVALRPAVAAAPQAGIVGFAKSTVAGCPMLEWRVAHHADGRVSGIFWYSDMSGTSGATGTITQAGHFHTVLTSAVGNGPVGVVNGERSPDGSVIADLKGAGCANYHVMKMAPVADLNSYSGGGSG
jgi:hypothetical protein